MKTTAAIFLLAGCVAFGQARTSFTVNNISALTNRVAINNEVVDVLGYSAPGDWGAPKKFYWDSTNTLAVGKVRRQGPAATGRWIHPWDGDLAAFGVLPLSTADFSAATPTDYTVEIQEAVDYAYANGISSVYFPKSGGYSASTIRLRGMRFKGKLATSINVNSTLSGNTYFFQRPNPTNHFLYFDANASQEKGAVEDIYLVGQGGIYTPNKKTITAVNGRWQIAVSTNDAPASIGTRAAYPKLYLGLYSNEGQWLGAAVVTNTFTSGTNYFFEVPEREAFYAAAYSATSSNTANQIIATLAFTNIPAAGNTIRFISGNSNYTWTSSSVYANYSPVVGSTISDSVTNLAFNVHRSSEPGLTLRPEGTNLYVYGEPGRAISITTTGSFATITYQTNTAYLLRPGVDKVAISPLDGSSWPDPIKIGYAGIYHEPGFGLELKNVRIEKFHVGVALASSNGTYTPFLRADNVMVAGCEFAGFAGKNWLETTDSYISWASASGFFYKPGNNRIASWSATETNTIWAADYRKTTYGSFNFNATTFWNYFLADSCVNGMYYDSTFGGWINHLWTDNTIQHGLFVRRGNAQGGGEQGLKINTWAAQSLIAITDNNTRFIRTNKAIALRVPGELDLSGTSTFTPDVKIASWNISYLTPYTQFDYSTEIRGDSANRVIIDDIIQDNPAFTHYFPGSQKIWRLNGLRIDSSDRGRTVGDSGELFTINGRLFGTRVSDGSYINPTFTPANSSGDISGAAVGVVSQTGIGAARNSDAIVDSSAANGAGIFRGRTMSGSQSSPGDVTNLQVAASFRGAIRYSGSDRDIGRMEILPADIPSSNNWNSVINFYAIGTNSLTEKLLFVIKAPSGSNGPASYQTGIWVYDYLSNTVARVLTGTNGTGPNGGRVLYIP